MSSSETTSRVALITGSASSVGIGYAIAMRLADDGFDIAFNDLEKNSKQLEDAVKVVESKGRRAIFVIADASTEEGVVHLVAETAEKLGSLDVAVANAGIFHYGTSILDAKVEDFDKLLSINVRGTMLLYKYAAKQMVKQGRGGRLIGASSIAGKAGYTGVSTYSATKFAVRGLTQSAALDLAQYNITVNAYAPGFIESDMTRDILGDLKVTQGVLVGQTRDVAAAVGFLVSPQASFITGQSLNINGGSLFD